MGGTASPEKIEKPEKTMLVLPVAKLPLALIKKKETPTSQQLSILQSEYINEHQKPEIESAQRLTPKMGTEDELSNKFSEELTSPPKTTHTRKPKQFILIPNTVAKEEGHDDTTTVVKTETANSQQVDTQTL